MESIFEFLSSIVEGIPEAIAVFSFAFITGSALKSIYMIFVGILIVLFCAVVKKYISPLLKKLNTLGLIVVLGIPVATLVSALLFFIVYPAIKWGYWISMVYALGIITAVVGLIHALGYLWKKIGPLVVPKIKRIVHFLTKPFVKKSDRLE